LWEAPFPEEQHWVVIGAWISMVVWEIKSMVSTFRVGSGDAERQHISMSKIHFRTSFIFFLLSGYVLAYDVLQKMKTSDFSKSYRLHSTVLLLLNSLFSLLEQVEVSLQGWNSRPRDDAIDPQEV
jgi:hypothetical protein